MLYPTFLNVGFLVILLIVIREISKESKLFNKRFIFVVGAVLIINIFLSYHYIQIQSSHNIATYNLYELTSDSMGQMRKVAYEDTESMEDIIVSNQVITDIHGHTYPLLMQLDRTKLVSRKQHQLLYATIEDLSEQLGIFLKYHNSIIAKGEEIEVSQFEKYNQLKSELFNFAHNFRSGGSRSGTRFGIVQYKLFLEDRDISRLQKIAVEISEIIGDLTSEN
ncbi:MAG: hypothetical protein JJT76_00105 [Clostridiaceae bacterium]|nr:hypothetical protein [Clostridiaceae bacterium]